MATSRKTGAFYPCKVCGTPVWRTPSDVEKYNRKQTCSKKCMGVMLSGQNNPFWNRTHSDETKQTMRQQKLGKPGKGGPPKGYQHTPEAKRKMSEAVRQRWLTNRDKMIAALPRGEDHPFHKNPVERRHRSHFSAVQKREWLGDHCAYCGTTEKLELDHIIPIFDGGPNVKENAQTLCRNCNVWKTTFVDKPRYLAAKAIQGALPSLRK